VGVLRLSDAFVLRVNTAASGAASLVYSTYVSGAADEAGKGIAVDRSNQAYVTGWTTSGDFPDAAGVAQTGGWLLKLPDSGSAASYLTRVGDGHDFYEPRAIAVDGSGSAYVAGLTTSRNFVAKHSPDAG